MQQSLMPDLLLAARLSLFGVFAVAGLSKLADRSGCRQMLIAFGSPEALARPLGLGLPLGELLIALALLPLSSAYFGAIAALSLLCVFLVAIAVNLARGRRPACNCFGQIQSAPIGWSTLARDMGFAGIAGLIVWQAPHNPGLSVVAWVEDLSVGQRAGLAVGIAILLLLLALLRMFFEMLRQQGRLLLRLDALEERLAPASDATLSTRTPAAQAGLRVGSPAPGFRLGGLLGETVTLEALLAERKSTLLVFTNPHCGPCQALMPDVGRWQREYASLLTIAVVSEGTADDNLAKSVTGGVSPLLLQKKREVAEAYQAWGTPAAVLVWPDGSVASPTVQGAEAIRTLVAKAVTDVPHRYDPNRNGRSPSPAKFGEAAPPLRLPDLAGRVTDLQDFRGHQILLLFWNPACGFCQQMLNDLREWDADPPSGAPELLVISTGSAKDNLAMNLRSRVLLDQNGQGGRSFGANGTPMAVLIDAQGKIASDVAQGAMAVFALAGTGAGEVVRR